MDGAMPVPVVPEQILCDCGTCNALTTQIVYQAGQVPSEPKNPSDLWEDNPYVPKDEQIVPTALLFALCVVIPLGKQQFFFSVLGADDLSGDWNGRVGRVSLRFIGNEMMLRTNCHMESRLSD